MIIQRVKRASVTVENEIIGKIGPGIMVLVGFTHKDTEKVLKKAVKKLLNIRLWNTIQNSSEIQKNEITLENLKISENEKIQNSEKKKKIKSWDSNLMQNNYELLIVSQFTLYGILKGNKPDFHHSLPAKEAEILYEQMISDLKKYYKNDKIQSGKFGAKMEVDLCNDGPVTLNIEYNE